MKGENLGFRLWSHNSGVEIEGYNGTCFCTPKDGWRNALKTFVHDLIGDDYYISFPTGSDMLITSGSMPSEIQEKIVDVTEKLQKQLNSIAINPKLDQVDILALEKAIINYKGVMRHYNTDKIDKVNF
jgi:hypothetical protein